MHVDLWQRPKVLLQSSWQLRKILKSFQPEVLHVHGRSTALRCALAGRTADWFTLHNTHLTRQVAFYDAGLVRTYLSPWGKNFFVLDQLGGQYLQREFGVRPESIVQIRMALIASASAHRRLTNARTHTSDLALRPTKPSLCSWAAFIQANSLRSCRRRGSRSEDETGSPQIRSDGGSTKALSSTISIRPAWTQVQT